MLLPSPSISSAAAREASLANMRALRDEIWESKNVAMALRSADVVGRVTDKEPIEDLIAHVLILVEAGDPMRALDLLESADVIKSDLRCRILAARCLMKFGRWDQLVELTDVSKITCEETVSELDKAFRVLVEKYMTNYPEQEAFVNALAFSGPDADFYKLFYLSQIKKYGKLSDMETTLARLENDYCLKEDHDIMASRVELLFVQSRYAECVKICSTLGSALRNFKRFPEYIYSLQEISAISVLHALASDLFVLQPEAATTWLATGMYYLAVEKSAVARPYFQKAVAVDPSMGIGWLALGHSFSDESDMEQAFEMNHIPLMHLGMEYLAMENYIQAKVTLEYAVKMCEFDPLLMNEMGTFFFRTEDTETALVWFKKAYELCDSGNTSREQRQSTAMNVGHCYRKIGEFAEAAKYFEDALDPRCAEAYAALGIIAHKQHRLVDAIDLYTKALRIDPKDEITHDLLAHAISSRTPSVATCVNLIDQFRLSAQLPDPAFTFDCDDSDEEFCEVLKQIAANTKTPQEDSRERLSTPAVSIASTSTFRAGRLFSLSFSGAARGAGGGGGLFRSSVPASMLAGFEGASPIVARRGAGRMGRSRFVQTSPRDGDSHRGSPHDEDSHPGSPHDEDSHPGSPRDEDSHPGSPRDADQLGEDSHPGSPRDADDVGDDEDDMELEDED
ncbi:hypothetical protein BDK51DRAFT_29289 [Blyttiomyces helicus]|uniref:Uncharacterized protein n=1 Tax=Blyttiomyces helicus TaxID=388810 RepID=A0A4P9WN09_9FUNG|nr:hypothetical protein BDK51DRAFT_29289 [Blyttiomyces helicus]|eukprot:RKO94314.1 hypothetical protein BDK51DRAFT_29289 [Blyttiomyces helicus]